MLLKIALLLLFVVLYKFILKPLYYIYLYTKNKGVAKLKFIPIVGPFANLETDLKKYGDSFYPSKKAYEGFPGARAIAFNVADRGALTILDPQLIKEYYLKAQDNYVKYQLTYKNKARIFGNGVAFAEGEEWKRRRVVTTALMNFDFFEIILPKLQQTAQKVISELNFQNGTTKFNALQVSSVIAGEAIVKCFFGTDLHNMKFRGEPIALAMSKFITQVSDIERELIVFFFGSNVLKLGLTKKHQQINQKILEMRAFGKQIVDAKIKSSETDQEMNFIKYIKEKGYLDSDKPIHLTSTQLLQEFFTFFVGGMDTTAHLLHMAMYYLSIYPQMQQKVRNQIKDIQDKPSILTINKLKYLDNFITETNRHYGFMNSFFPREATQDHMLGDIKIYKGTLLMMGWLSNYYNPQYFPEPFTFNPDRWNEPLEQPYSFIPFSAGKRTCIGKNLALIEIKLVIIKLLKQHKLTGDPNYNLRLTFRSLYEPVDPIILSATKLTL